MAKKYIGAIDQGTTSTRFVLFDHEARIVSAHQLEHRQIYPQPGWVEHDPMEIWQRTQEVIRGALDKKRIAPEDIAAIGVTNQRETTVIWNKKTGQCYHNAIVWQCVRTRDIGNALARDGGPNRFRPKTGLPIATYFSGPKIKWALDNIPGVRAAAEKGEAIFGNMDSWEIWWLTGGPDGGVHLTDVSNASRTMLMNLETLDWDQEILDTLGIPRQMLPEIRPSSEPELYGLTAKDGPLGAEIPVCGNLGDQQAALVGQTCFRPGEVKNTYGTGGFMLLNTGTRPVSSQSGLLTTVGYRFGAEPAVYCLEGSIAIAGALVQWLRDNLKFFGKSSEVEALAQTVGDSGGIYFVPAFSGLFAPYWDSSARGVIVGLTGYINRGHIARAALEATAYQTRQVCEVMAKEWGNKLMALKVDGGMVGNELLMQFQADILGVPVIRPVVTETTSLGAAYAAGLAVKFWSGLSDLRRNWKMDKKWSPRIDAQTREKLYQGWLKAVKRSFNWIE